MAVDKQILRESGLYSELTQLGGAKELQPAQIGLATNTHQMIHRVGSDFYHNLFTEDVAPTVGAIPIVGSDGFNMVVDGVALLWDDGNGILEVGGGIDVDEDVHLPDDKAITVGGTYAAPKARILWSTAETPDSLLIYTGGFTGDIILKAVTGDIRLEPNLGGDIKLRVDYYNHPNRIISELYEQDNDAVVDYIQWDATCLNTIDDGFGGGVNMRLQKTDDTMMDAFYFRWYWQTDDAEAIPYAQLGIWGVNMQQSEQMDLLMSWDALESGWDWNCLCYANFRMQSADKFVETDRIRARFDTTDLFLQNYNGNAGWMLEGDTGDLVASDSGTIPTDIYSEAVQAFTPGAYTGWTATPSFSCYYKRVGRLVFVWFYISGSATGAAVDFGVPYDNDTGTGVRFSCKATDNSTLVNVRGTLNGAGSQTVTLQRVDAAWSGTGTLAVEGSFVYETADLA